jgi:hypothetical protein
MYQMNSGVQQVVQPQRYWDMTITDVDANHKTVLVTVYCF